MNLSERNRKNVISRWRKVHSIDREYISQNKGNSERLKSRLFGYIAGDGNILTAKKGKSTHNTLRFYPDHKSLIVPYEEAIKKVYNKRSKIKQEINYYCLSIDSKPLVEDLNSSGLFGTFNWNIPSFILNKDINKIEWIKAFFDTEAHVHKKYIRVQSVNEIGLNHVQKILGELKIHSKIYEYLPKKERHSKVFMLTIYRKEAKKRYLDLIGFNHTIKLKKLKATLQNTAAVA